MKKILFLTVLCMSFLPFVTNVVQAETWEAQGDVPVNKQWEITLNEPYRQALDLSQFVDVQHDGQHVDVTVERGDTANKIIVIPPADGYIYDMNYELKIDAALQSERGQTLQRDVVLPFTTAKLEEIQFTPREDSTNTLTLQENVVELDEADIAELFDGDNRLLLHVPERSLLATKIAKGTILTLPPTYDYPFGHAVKVTSITYDANNEITDLQYVDAALEEVFGAIDISVVNDDVDINPAFIRYPEEARTLNGVTLNFKAPKFNVAIEKNGFSFNFKDYELTFGKDGEPIPYYEKTGDYSSNVTLTLATAFKAENIKTALDIGWHWDWHRSKPVIEVAEMYADISQSIGIDVEGTMDVKLRPLLAEIPIPYAAVKGAKNLKAGMFFQVYLNVEMGVDGKLKYDFIYNFSLNPQIVEDDGDYSFSANVGDSKPKHNLQGFIQTDAAIGVGLEFPVHLGKHTLGEVATDVLVQGNMQAGMLTLGEACAKFNAGLLIRPTFSIAKKKYDIGGDISLLEQNYTNCKPDFTVDYDVKNGEKAIELRTTTASFEQIIAAEKDELIHVEVGDLEGNLRYSVLKWDNKKHEWTEYENGTMYEHSNGVYIKADEKAPYKLVLRTQGKYFSPKKHPFTYEVIDAAQYKAASEQERTYDIALQHEEVYYLQYVLEKGDALQLRNSGEPRINYAFQQYNDETNKWQTIDTIGSSAVNYRFLANKGGHYRVTVGPQLVENETADIALQAAIIKGDEAESDSRSNARPLVGTSGEVSYTLHANEDRDYFSIDLKAGQALQIHTNPNVQTYFYYNENGSWKHIDSRRFSVNTAAYRYLAANAGEYIVEAENYSDYNAGELTLSYAVIDGDEAETDSRSNARPLVGTSGTMNYTLHANEDRDYFSIDLKAGQALQIHTNPNVQTYFYYNENGSWKHIDSRRFSTNTEPYRYVAASAGQYMVEVENYNSYQSKQLQLSYSVQ